MRRLAPHLFTYAVAACAAIAYHVLPWHWVQRGLWLIGAAVAAWVVYIVVQTALSLRRLRQVARESAQAAPMPCPPCGGTEHDYKSQGLWDGVPDPVTGRRPGGSFGYGICKACGSRWGQWDDRPPYVPTDEEWEREVAYFEKKRAEQLRQWTEHHAPRTDPVQPS